MEINIYKKGSIWAIFKVPNQKKMTDAGAYKVESPNEGAFRGKS